MKKIGILGVGNMGSAILHGLCKNGLREQLFFMERNKQQAKLLAQETQVSYVEEMQAFCQQGDYFILAIKPDGYEAVLKEMARFLREEQIVISITPGKSVKDLQKMLQGHQKVVRAMPNMPAKVQAGMSAVCYDAAYYTEEEEKMIEIIFSAIGAYEVVSEEMMDLVVCASGSSPAYIYLMIEALADGLVKNGFPRQKAYFFVAQTMLGSAKLLLETKQHPAVLKDQICSPGGTTMAGVAQLEKFGFRNALIQATDACYKKVQNMKGE